MPRCPLVRDGEGIEKRRVFRSSQDREDFLRRLSGIIPQLGMSLTGGASCRIISTCWSGRARHWG
jgi:hypothetical protein